MSLLNIIKSPFLSTCGFYLLIYLFLLLVTCQSVYLAIFINCFLFSYVLLFWFRYKSNKFKRYVLYGSIGNFIVFELMVASYAELLVWEHILHIAFYLMTYFYYLKSIYNSADSVTYQPFFDFKTIGYMKRNNM